MRRFAGIGTLSGIDYKQGFPDHCSPFAARLRLAESSSYCYFWRCKCATFASSGRPLPQKNASGIIRSSLGDHSPLSRPMRTSFSVLHVLRYVARCRFDKVLFPVMYVENSSSPMFSAGSLRPLRVFFFTGLSFRAGGYCATSCTLNDSQLVGACHSCGKTVASICFCFF